MGVPYPNFPPNYHTVRTNGGFSRDCLIVELSTIGKLDQAKLAQLEDAIAMAVAKFMEVEKHQIVRSDNFNTELLRALRL